jgi:hypothetical protein
MFDNHAAIKSKKLNIAAAEPAVIPIWGDKFTCVQDDF